MLSRGLGHIPDLDDHVRDDLRDRHVDMLVGAAPVESPVSVDYSPLLDGITDQGATSSCVGQAFSTATYLRSHIAGIPLPRPSAKAIYDCARLLDTPNTLVDVGCRPRQAIVGMQMYGLVADSRWPLTEGNVNTPPPLDVIQHGLGAKLADYYRIAGDDVPGLVRQALASGYVPCFAMQVDDAYMNYGGEGVYQGPTGVIRGSHMQAVIGYGPDYFLVANSWGTGWGMGGLARIAPDVFASAAVSDVLVATVLPALVS